jgi:glycerophosphoryl diester phosphodiesterase
MLFQEFLQFIRAKEAELNRSIGIYLETKHPSYFTSMGLDQQEPLLASLEKYNYNTEKDNVFLESFESTNLKRLKQVFFTLRKTKNCESEKFVENL